MLDFFSATNVTVSPQEYAGAMKTNPEKPISSPPSIDPRGTLAYRRRRVIFASDNNNYTGSSGSPVSKGQNSNRETFLTNQSQQKHTNYCDDVKIAAAVNIFNAQTTNSNYYCDKVKEISKIDGFDLPTHMISEVARGVENMTESQYGRCHEEIELQHYMTSWRDRTKRFNKQKAIMKRPSSLAPVNSQVYKCRHHLKTRQLETKTIIIQKIKEVSNFLFLIFEGKILYFIN
jgi:hypothetical protein